MNVPPYLLDLQVREPDGSLHRIWLPLFLLWPLFLVLAVLAFILTLLVDIALWASGQKYHYYTFLLGGVFGMFADLRGTTVYINSGSTFVDMTIR